MAIPKFESEVERKAYAMGRYDEREYLAKTIEEAVPKIALKDPSVKRFIKGNKKKVKR